MLSAKPQRPASGDLESLGAYWTFHSEVAARQLRAWLPRRPARVLDLSGGEAVHVHAAALGHEVLRVVEPRPSGSTGSSEDGNPRVIVGDPSHPAFVADTVVDAVVAEQLSASLATEATVSHLRRVLRPGGRLLLQVDSRLMGMAQLAQQHCWAQLSDAPSAEVLLVPLPDGTIRRCFWPEQLRELLSGAGLEVQWMRPRTVLSPAVVRQALAEEPEGLGRLVETELSLPADQADESFGMHLVASAQRPD